MIDVMQNGVEYTHVRAIGMSAVPIGDTIVYPPLKKPYGKEAFENYGIMMSGNTPDALDNSRKYDEMVKQYKMSKEWVKVVSRDPKHGIDNRGIIEFYKSQKELEEKDEKEVRKYYEDLEKKKQQKT